MTIHGYQITYLTHEVHYYKQQYLICLTLVVLDNTMKWQPQ